MIPPRHVDEFIDDHQQDAYARWFFMLHRLSAVLQADFREYIAGYQLYCTYGEGAEAKRYRVAGCSRLGDVWLTANFNQDVGYQHRVGVQACSQWSSKP